MTWHPSREVGKGRVGTEDVRLSYEYEKMRLKYNDMFYEGEEQPDRRRPGQDNTELLFFLPGSAGSWSLEGPVSSLAPFAEGGWDQQGG